MIERTCPKCHGLKRAGYADDRGGAASLSFPTCRCVGVVPASPSVIERPPVPFEEWDRVARLADEHRVARRAAEEECERLRRRVGALTNRLARVLRRGHDLRSGLALEYGDYYRDHHDKPRHVWSGRRAGRGTKP